MKLAKDPTIENINRRRALARLGSEKVDMIRLTVNAGTRKWVEFKDRTWPKREKSEIQAEFKWPIYSE